MKQADTDHNQTIPQSFTHQFTNCLSLSNSREQRHSLSETVASGLGFSNQNCSNMKRSNSPQLHEPDSMSSVLMFPPDLALSNVDRTKSSKQNIVPESDNSEHVRAECCWTSPPSSGTADHPRYQGQFDLNHSMASESYPWTESYFGSFISVCSQNPIMYTQTAREAPARLPLPIEFTGNFPVFVNARQYGAIIRRRKIRSRLEAQNKLLKSKKPYLHESRHRHAVRRARGSGGRFLKSKAIENTEPISHNHGECQSDQNSQSGSWDSSPRKSDITSMFNGDGIFPRQELNVWNSPLQIGFSTMAVAEGLTARRI